MPEPVSSPAPSPLLEASSQSLDELFNRDPHELTVGSKPLTAIVAELRRYRALWQEEAAQGKVRSSAKQPKVSKPLVTLGDLGL